MSDPMRPWWRPVPIKPVRTLLIAGSAEQGRLWCDCNYRRRDIVIASSPAAIWGLGPFDEVVRVGTWTRREDLVELLAALDVEQAREDRDNGEA